MNSKCEYNRCSIPRLSLKMGRKPVKEKEEEEELQAEQELENRIRKLKFTRKSAGSSLEGPKPKRRRVEEKVQKNPWLYKPTHVLTGSMLSSKRKRKKEDDVSDIRKYLKKEKFKEIEELDVVLQIEDDQEDNQSSRNMFASNVMTNDRLTVMPTTRKKTRLAKKLSSQEYSKKMLESVPYQESSNFIQNEIEVSENRLCLEERKVREAMPK